MVRCPVCGMSVDEKSAPSSFYKGKQYFFMNPIHKAMFDKDPEKFLGQMGNQGDHQE